MAYKSGPYRKVAPMERMTTEEMERYLIMEMRKGSSELEAYRGLMYVLGLKWPSDEKEEGSYA